MKNNYLYMAAIGILIIIIIFCFSRGVQANTLNIAHTETQYNYSFPANIILDDTSTGYSVSYGFDIMPYWTLDLGYSDLGRAEQMFLLTPTKFEVSLLTLLLHGKTEIGMIAGHSVKAHGLVGVARGDAKVTLGMTSISDKDLGLMYGGGLSLNLAHHHSITAMYKKSVLDFNNTVNFDYNPELFEIGYSYMF